MTLDDAAVATVDEGPSARDCQAHRSARRSAAPATLVLFVGPDLQPSRATSDILVREGMRSLSVAGLAPALRAAGLARFDAAVIGAVALGGRGVVALGELHAALRCPLIVLTKVADEIDEILALEFGASAYLIEPVAPRRLRAHLAAAMRRGTPSALEVGGKAATAETGWQLDRVCNELRRGAKRATLTDVQATLLQCLMEARGLIVPRAQLAAALPNQRQLATRSIDVYVHRLRQRLGEEGVDDMRIKAVRGRGYQLTDS
jgi:two-component system, OmpR family, response regulator